MFSCVVVSMGGQALREGNGQRFSVPTLEQT